ncbi:MAG: sigma-E processing peptidase SpoIIGA [Clostridia bacterium]|nr:sigma-E processing peptidase SpoIIGA [Clostridia bacterium]
MEMYADILFFVNAISTFILLDLTSRIRKCKIVMKRKIIASIIGGAIAVMVICFYDIGFIIRICGFVVIPIFAFGIKRAEIIIFSIMSAIMSAVFMAIDTFSQFSEVYVNNGIIYFNIPIIRFIAVFAITYAVIVAGMYFFEKYKGQKYKKVKIMVGDKSVTIKALVDSGNLLREPVSGLPVIVCEWSRVMSLFDNMEFNDFRENVVEFRIRLVPYKTVGGGKRIMCAFFADSIGLVDENRVIGGAYIGITTNKLSDENKYSALIGATI